MSLYPQGIFYAFLSYILSVTSYLPPNLNQLTLDLEAALLELKKVNTASSNKTKIQAAK